MMFDCIITENEANNLELKPSPLVFKTNDD